MTRCDDLNGLGQFDFLTAAAGLFQPGGLQKTVNDVTALAQNPITGAVKSVEFWTAYSPPTKYSGTELDAIYRDPTPNPYLKFIQPTIVLDTVLGTRTISPYGAASRTAWQANVKQLKIGTAALVGFSVIGLLVVGAALGRVRK